VFETGIKVIDPCLRAPTAKAAGRLLAVLASAKTVLIRELTSNIRRRSTAASRSSLSVWASGTREGKRPLEEFRNPDDQLRRI